MNPAPGRLRSLPGERRRYRCESSKITEGSKTLPTQTVLVEGGMWAFFLSCFRSVKRGGAITTCLFLRAALGGDVQDSLCLLEPEIPGRVDGNRLLPVPIGEPSSVLVFLIYNNAINSKELSVWPCQPFRIRNETAGWERFILHPVAE